MLIRLVNNQQFTIRISVEDTEKDIQAHLPLGTPRDRVEAYLEKNGIEHSYVDDQSGEYTRTEMAMIRNASNTWLVRGDIQILFRFDKQGKLADHSVRQILTGP